MDVALIRVGGHHKLMLPAGKFHRQLAADFVRLLRADFIRLE